MQEKSNRQIQLHVKDIFKQEAKGGGEWNLSFKGRKGRQKLFVKNVHVLERPLIMYTVQCKYFCTTSMVFHSLSHQSPTHQEATP